ncbi:multiubiquitin domain-containing protein [Bradyrhizobium sp. 2]|uniref:multiubiquitin domain-containing protein n=1 Tax=Bradyrhizobium sp. 2 TaxID=190045 RepID=UPI001FF8E13D|nr:multiubiquitin domain-containing protein [Bradyrhizobium sp. 2]MCK1463083.1 multiubiquitin domain-containing protein [Bradyrhizobium sp. 2]
MAKDDNNGHGGGNPGQGDNPGQGGGGGNDHSVTIIVEGTAHEWTKKEITYDQVVTLEVPDYAQHPEITYSVTFKKGQGNKPEGDLAKGESVKVKDGMIFNVSETGQS